MQNNIIWEGLNNESIENCNVLTNDNGYEAGSIISMCQNDEIYTINYQLQINKYWESQYCKITRCNGENKALELRRLPGNHWLINGSEDSRFTGFDGLDIAITPFTNTLVINRRQMHEEESLQLRIIYIEPVEMVCQPN